MKCIEEKRNSLLLCLLVLTTVHLPLPLFARLVRGFCLHVSYSAHSPVGLASRHASVQVRAGRHWSLGSAPLLCVALLCRLAAVGSSGHLFPSTCSLLLLHMCSLPLILQLQLQLLLPSPGTAGTCSPTSPSTRWFLPRVWACATHQSSPSPCSSRRC